MHKIYMALMAVVVIGTVNAMNQQPKVFGAKKLTTKALVLHKDAKKQEVATPFAGTQKIIMKYVGVKDCMPTFMQKPQYSRL